jgi:hypothetical protein
MTPTARSSPQLPFVCVTRPPGATAPPPVTVLPAAAANGTDVLVAASAAVPKLLAAAASRRASAALRAAAAVLAARPALVVQGQGQGQGRQLANDASDAFAAAAGVGGLTAPSAAGRRLTAQLAAPPGAAAGGGGATGGMGGAGARFQLLTGNFTWQAAEAACRAAGGHLATFDDYRQQLLVEATYTGLVGGGGPGAGRL